MRCGCNNCGAFMVHADEKEVCVCPECGSRCSACLGTNTVVSRESLKRLANIDWINRDIEKAQDSLDGEADDRSGYDRRGGHYE